MSRFKILMSFVLALAGALLAAMAVSAVSDHLAGQRTLSAPAATPDLVARGAYLAKLGDCAGCHSVDGRPPFSGGLRMKTPVGAIYSSNITPDPRYGIGGFSLADFDRALRFGVARGHTLYPAMPYTAYSRVKPGDIAALYAYFQHGVAPAAVPVPRNGIVFPLSMRWPLTFWRWLFAPTPHPFSRHSGDATVDAGAYFVEGLGHCGECHTPRGWGMQVRALTPADGAAFLSGSMIQGYFAPSLRSEGRGSLSGWNESELARFLTTGANPVGASFGPMNEVITHSTQYLLPADALAAAKYLKSLHGAGTTSAGSGSASVTASAGSPEGAAIYASLCGGCHRPDGTGIPGIFPRLAGNLIVQAPNAASIVAIVLLGSKTAQTAAAPVSQIMPNFGGQLSDSQLAAVVTYVRGSWGNRADPVSAEDVQRLRTDLHAGAMPRRSTLR